MPLANNTCVDQRSGILTATYAAQRIILNGRPIALATFHRKRQKQEIPPPIQITPRRYWCAEQIELFNRGLIKPNREIREWLEANEFYEEDSDSFWEGNTWCNFNVDTCLWNPLPNQYLTLPVAQPPQLLVLQQRSGS